MSFAPIYGLKRTRIILYEADGTTPSARVTLQKETREGLELAYKPLGKLHQLGSGAGWEEVWIHRGWKPSLTVKWSHGLESTVETWNGGSWVGATLVPTAQALSQILDSVAYAPCQVSPHLDLNLDFQARFDPDKSFGLRDLKGVVHTGLELALIGTKPASNLPSWDTLNQYFAEGYIADGYIGFVP